MPVYKPSEEENRKYEAIAREMAAERAASRSEPSGRPMWEFHGVLWRCVDHGKPTCIRCGSVLPSPTRPGRKGEIVYSEKPRPEYTGRTGARENLSLVGERTEAGLACPKCGGMQFTAKRSKTGKVGLGVLAPKTQVKCVTCGMMFKRG